MILTVTLNPAVDKTIYINNFKSGEVNKVEYSVKDPGGKGINVSKVIHNLDCKTTSMGFIGGESGNYIRESLIQMGINEMFTQIDSNTRTNIKVVDLVSGITTDINEKGSPISPEEQEEFLKTYMRGIKKANLAVISGSVPRCIDKGIYRQLIEIAKEQGCEVILDASGKLLKEGIKGQPKMIKPNIDELEDILSIKLDTSEKVIDASREIVKSGVEMVCVSMGGEGAVLIGKEFVYQANIVKVHVKSTVGAGDSLVGGIAAGLSRGMSIKDAFRLGIAASIVAVTKEGTKAPTYQEVESMIDKVNIVKMD